MAAPLGEVNTNSASHDSALATPIVSNPPTQPPQPNARKTVPFFWMEGAGSERAQLRALAEGRASALNLTSEMVHGPKGVAADATRMPQPAFRPLPTGPQSPTAGRPGPGGSTGLQASFWGGCQARFPPAAARGLLLSALATAIE